VSRWHRSLAARVGLALLLAAAVIAALQYGVDRRDQQRRAQSMRAAGAGVDRPAAPSPLQALGFVLQPTAAAVLLASRLQALAPDVAPVVQVLADGTVALRRPAPVSQSPAATSAGRRVGILLPTTELDRLGPAVRGTLVELLAALLVDRPVAADRVQLVDVGVGSFGLGPLLAWVP
jgi:hypothetical protein